MKLERRPTATIFDLDGTLLDTEPLYTQATQQVVGQYGAKFDWDLKARTLGGDARWGAKVVIEALDLPLTIDEYLMRRTAILRRLFANANAMPGALETVQRLQHAGMRVAVGTSSVRALCDIKWRSHHWLQRMEVFVCGDDAEVSARKPSPDIFLTAARRLSAKPQDCLVFEDSPAGVQAARAAGMQVIALRAPELDPALFSDADWVIESYAELNLRDIGW